MKEEYRNKIAHSIDSLVIEVLNQNVGDSGNKISIKRRVININKAVENCIKEICNTIEEHDL